MVKFSPFVTLLLLGAANAAVPPGPSEFEEQGDRALAYGDWSNPSPRGQGVYGRPNYDYRAGNYAPRPDYRAGNIRGSNDERSGCKGLYTDITVNCSATVAYCFITGGLFCGLEDEGFGCKGLVEYYLENCNYI